MVVPTRIKQRISEAVEELPAENLPEVLQFVEFLRSKITAPRPKRIARLRGLWANIPFDITDENIRELRRRVTEHLDKKVV
jgi:hypothetical protein